MVASAVHGAAGTASAAGAAMFAVFSVSDCGHKDCRKNQSNHRRNNDRRPIHKISPYLLF